MSLIKWEPFDEFNNIFRDHMLAPLSRRDTMGFDMAVDIYEDGNNLVAEMNVPGLSAENIDVEVEDDHVRIAGRREEVQEKKEKSHYAKEIRRGSFERLIPLPDRVEQDNVEASYEDGVLKVIMPKRERAPEKKVRIAVKK